MFVILLRFAANKTQAPQFMEDHKAWIDQGFQDGVFLTAGSLQPNAGGAILAHATTRDDLEARVNQDPFVVHGVVGAEILEFTPARADQRLNFLVA